MQLSEHFDSETLTFSDIAIRKGLDNTPTQYVLDALKLLCDNVLEPLQLAITAPIHIVSGYRSNMVHHAHGGNRKESDHMYGQAVDFRVPGLTTTELWKNIILGKYGDIQYYQIIHEYGGWVHISYKPVNMQRMMIMSSKLDRLGKTLTDAHFRAEIEKLKI